ncbi:MAG: hypothetical protein IT365_03670 [Candidatus Hydrogenedentes bacterium]|nr:hypothetical protein [Candidatus Hydrogenedentota bacterium]
MSDVVRNYTGTGGSLRSGRRRRAGRGLFRKVVLPGVILVLLVFLWVTRDSYDVTECLPAGQGFSVVLSDPLNSLDRAGQSRLWEAVPAQWSQQVSAQNLAQRTGMPDWVVNNLFHDRLFLFGNDTHHFGDVVAITRMTRIGTLLERFHRIAPGIDRDFAGGLELRKVAESRVYYAVRGRLLILSPSREALIHSLTLAPGATMGEDALSDLTQSGTEDIRGAFTVSPEHPLGTYVRRVAFALRIDGESAHAKCRAELNPEWKAAYGPLFAKAHPVPLGTPPPGMVEISANFGIPVAELWPALGTVYSSEWMTREQWEVWANPSADGTLKVSQFITGLLADRGPGIRLALTGIDTNEMLPMPLLVGTFDGNVSGLPALFKAIPAPPETAMAWDSYPRYDEALGMVRVPCIGGPSMEPCAAVYGNALLASTSRNAAEQVLASAPPSGNLPQEGNLYVRVRPLALAESIVEAGRLFVAFDGLRGYSPESYETAATEWLACAGAVEEVTAMASVQGQNLDVDFRIRSMPRPKQ